MFSVLAVLLDPGPKPRKSTSADQDHFAAEMPALLRRLRVSARVQHDCARDLLLRRYMYVLCISRIKMSRLESFCTMPTVCHAGMMLWFAGTPCTFRTLRPGEVGYEVCACSGRPLEQRATVRDPLGGSIGTRQECCRHADRAHGVTIG